MMTSPDYSKIESKSLIGLKKYDILDAIPEDDYDNITSIASIVCNVPISLITFIDEKHQFFKFHKGLDLVETNRCDSFCANAINDPKNIFQITDARLDERFHDNPLVTGYPNIVFYAGMPLTTKDGLALGTLSVIDNKPRILTEEQIEVLKRLSRQVVNMIVNRERQKIEEQLKVVDLAVNSSSIAIFFYKKDGSFYNYNEAMCSMLGYTKEEFSNLNIRDINPNITEDYFALHWVDVQKEEGLPYQFKLLRKDGLLIEVEMRSKFVKYAEQELVCTYAIDITEKKKLIDKLNLVDFGFRNVSKAAFLTDNAGNLYDFNEAACQLLGYSKEEIEKLQVKDIDVFQTQEERAMFRNELRNVKSMTVTKKYKRKDGSLIDVELKCNYLYYEGMELDYIFVSDITEKIRAEEQLKLVDYAFRNSAVPTHFVREDGSIFDFNEQACTLLGYTKEEYSNLKAYEINKNVGANGFKEIWNNTDVDLYGSIYQTTLTRKDNILLDVELRVSKIRYGGNELLCTYILDFTEKKKMAERLELFQYSFKKSNVPTIILREDATFYSFNDAYLNLYGNTKDEIKNSKVYELHGGFDADTWNKYWERLRRCSGMSFETKRKTKDGIVKDVEIKAQIIKYRTLEVNYVYITDLTEKKKAEEKLKLVDFSFRNAATPILLLLPESYFFDFNDAMLDLLGYTREEFSPLTIADIDPSFDINSCHERWEEFRQIKRATFLHKLKKKDGRFVDVEIRNNLIVYGELEINFCFITDITEKKRTEEALRKSNERYENAAIATSEVVWEWNIEEDSNYFSPNFTKLFGHPINGLEYGEDNVWRRNLHPEDADRVLTNEGVAKKGLINKWEEEYRLRKSDGEFAYISDKGFSVKDEFGNVLKLVGAMSDITQRKEEENRLRLLESVVINTNDAVIITDTGSFETIGPKILYVNDAFTSMSGYTAQEVIGNTPRLLQATNSNKNELQKLKQALANWQNFEGTILNKKKNGEEFWVNLRISPVANEAGWFTHWVSIQRDVTKEKNAELEREQLIKQLIVNNKELTQFSYITTHNLRAPLTNLISICRMIEEDKLEDVKTKRLVNGFKQSTELLNDTLNDLIKILIIKEKPYWNKEEVVFQKILDKVKASVFIKLTKMSAIIESDFSQMDSVIFSVAYMESVLLNLVTNSLKFAHPTRLPVITIRSIKEKDDTTKLVYSDNGIGMDMELVKDKIFGLYQRFHDNAEGKGLGLYLIHSQITAFGGKIEVLSKEGVGTTFTITFMGQ